MQTGFCVASLNQVQRCPTPRDEYGAARGSYHSWRRRHNPQTGMSCPEDLPQGFLVTGVIKTGVPRREPWRVLCFPVGKVGCGET